VLFWTSFIELITLSTVYKMNEKDRAPGGSCVCGRASVYTECVRAGDFSFDPLGLGKDPEKKARYAISELKNGRLAMLAFSGASVESTAFRSLTMFVRIYRHGYSGCSDWT
jgi:hypothetical protein